MSTNHSLLDLPENIDDELAAKLAQSLGSLNNGKNASSLWEKVVPLPGMCLKTSSLKNNSKVFINICQSTAVPAPDREITEELIVNLTGTSSVEVLSQYRLPMSIGEPRSETDHAAAACMVYDVIIHSKLFDKVEKSQIVFNFVVSVILEGIEEKYGEELKKDLKKLKNKKYFGANIQEQHVRKKKLITEMDPVSMLPSKAAPQEDKEEFSAIKPRGDTPRFSIVQEPQDVDYPEFLLMEVQLPKIKFSSTIQLDVGEDRIVLQTRTGIYFLDIDLPFDVVQEDVGAQFNKITRVLSMTLPVQPKQ